MESELARLLDAVIAKLAVFALDPKTPWRLLPTDDPKILVQCSNVFEGKAENEVCSVFIMFGTNQVTGNFIISGVGAVHRGRLPAPAVQLPHHLLLDIAKALGVYPKRYC